MFARVYKTEPVSVWWAGHRGLLLAGTLALATSTSAAELDGVVDVIVLPPRVPAPTATRPPVPPVVLDTIVVTARKRHEILQDVPVSMATLSAQDIAERQITGIHDIAAQVPGFQFGEFAGTGQVSIRGVGFNLISGIGENSTAIHVDGLYLPRPSASTLVYEDLAAVEVLRGPQGTLYGRNATGGVVNLISTPPPAAPGFSAGMLYGKFDRRRVKASGGAGLADGRLRLWASGTLDDRRDDVFINLRFPGRDQGARQRGSVRFNGDLDLGSDVRVELRSFRVEEEGNGYHIEAYKPGPGALLAPRGSYTDEPYTHHNNDSGFTRKTLTGSSLKFTYEPEARWSLTALSGYTRFVVDGGGSDADGTSIDLFTTERLTVDRSWSQELLLNFTGDRLQWTTGLYYFDEDFDPVIDALLNPVGVAGVAPATLSGLLPPRIANLLDSLPASDPFAGQLELRLNNVAAEDTRSFALFSDVTYEVMDRVRIYSGLRSIDERKGQVLTVRQVIDGTDLGNTDCAGQRSQLRTRPITGRIGAQFDARRGAMIYAQYARGFKAGGFAIASCDDRYAAETLDAYELGFKTHWLARRLRANGAVFHYDYSNLQVEEVSLPFVFVNNAQARIHGAELELRWVPASAWMLSANAGWLDAFYTAFFNNDNAASLLGATPLAQPVDLAGRRLNRAPEWSLGAAIDYQLSTSRDGRLSLRLDAAWKGEYFLREFNTPTDRQAAHTITNFFASYRVAGSGVTLRGFVKNATDEAVLGGLLGVAGYKSASFNLPRTWGIGVDYAFRL